MGESALGAFCVSTIKGVDAAVVWIITAGLTNTLRISGCSRLSLPEGKHPVFYEVNHQLASRMREICMSGSEGGAALPSLPLSTIYAV